MGCNQSKTKNAKKKAAGDKKKDGSRAGEMMVSEVNRPAPEGEATSRQSDAHPSQAGRNGTEQGSEAQQAAAAQQRPNAESESPETTYDNLQSESEAARQSQERRTDAAASATPPASATGAAAAAAAPEQTEEEGEEKEEEAATGAGADATAVGHRSAEHNSNRSAPAESAPLSPKPAEGEAVADTAADANNNNNIVTTAAHVTVPQEDTSEQSEVDFQILSEEEAPTFHTEPQTPGEEEAKGGEEASARGKSSETATTPNFQFAEEDVLSAPLPPAPVSEAEAVTPMAQETAPEPTPQPHTDRSSASHSRSSAPVLHTAAREEARRQFRLSSLGSEPHQRSLNNSGAGPKRRGLRKMNSASSPPKRKVAQERPPWVDVVTPPIESLEEEPPEQEAAEYHSEDHVLYAAAPPVPPSPKAPAAAAVPHRHVEQIDAEARTPSVHHSERLALERPSELPAPRSAARATPPLEQHQQPIKPTHPKQPRHPAQPVHRIPAAPPSESASEQEPVVPAAAMPMETPRERMAARRRRSSVITAEVIQLAPQQQPQQQPPQQAQDNTDGFSGPRTPRPQRTQAPLPIPPQHLQHLRTPPAAVAAAPPIPHRTVYTDPGPASETEPQHQQRRAAATAMPPPTAYIMDDAGRGPRRLHLDPSAMLAIEASTNALVRAHTPVATGSGTRATHKDPSVMSQRSLPPSTMDSAFYREPGKLLPSHLIDPVFGPTSGSPLVQDGRGPYDSEADAAAAAAPSHGSQAGRSKAGFSAHGSPAQSGIGSGADGYARPAPMNTNGSAVAAAAVTNGGRSGARSSASSRSGALRAAATYTAAKPPPGSSDFGSYRYGDDVDAVGESASYQHMTYSASSNSRGGFEQQYSNPQEPRERSAQPYEPSLTDEVPANAAVLRPGGAQQHPNNTGGAASSHDSRSNAGVGGAAAAFQPSKQSSAVYSKASWSPADEASLHGDDDDDDHAVEYEDEVVSERAKAAYQPRSYAEEHDAAYYNDNGAEEEEKEAEIAAMVLDDDGGAPAVGAAAGSFEEGALEGVAGEDTAGETTTAVAAVPSSEGHMSERAEPEWQLMQPRPEENKSLYQQAKFVAQMRNVTPI
jgi:hypothetical protein